MSKVSERDVLRKVCTRIAEIGGLKGISSRNLNNIESARKGVKELLDEYADKKYLAELERLKEMTERLKAIDDKVIEENCKLKTENHDLKALLKDKNAIISEITTENNKLRTQLQESDKKEMKLNEDIEELCRLNDSLLNKLKKLSPKWWEFWKW